MGVATAVANRVEGWPTDGAIDTALGGKERAPVGTGAAEWKEGRGRKRGRWRSAGRRVGASGWLVPPAHDQGRRRVRRNYGQCVTVRSRRGRRCGPRPHRPLKHEPGHEGRARAGREGVELCAPWALGEGAGRLGRRSRLGLRRRAEIGSLAGTRGRNRCGSGRLHGATPARHPPQTWCYSAQRAAGLATLDPPRALVDPAERGDRLHPALLLDDNH